jgi:ParB/RepB/Spo0J family partition protein
MPATIVDHAKPGMKIYDEETFGPVTTVVRVKGVDQTVFVANDTAWAELDELADDIRQHGILQPIVVHPADSQGRYRIHFGAKRLRAA